MAKETRSWEANDGSLHKSECDAVRRDLEILIAGSECAENPPYAKTMLKWMTSVPQEIAEALMAYAAACPIAAEVEPASFKPSDAPKLNVCSGIDFDARRAAAIGTMQELAQSPDKPAAREWLRTNGFDNLTDFNNRATLEDIEKFDRFVAELEDGNPPEDVRAEMIHHGS